MNKFFGVFFFILSASLSFAQDAVRCGGKLYSLDYMLHEGQSPFGTAILDTSLNGSKFSSLTLVIVIARGAPEFRDKMSDFLQNVLNEEDLDAPILWRASGLSHIPVEVTSSTLKLPETCFEKGKAKLEKVINYSKQGDLHSFEYNTDLLTEIKSTPFQYNFLIHSAFFRMYTDKIEDRSSLVYLSNTREVIFYPEESLREIFKELHFSSFGSLQGVCGRSPFIRDHLEQTLKLSCDLITTEHLKDLTTFQLIADPSGDRYLYPTDLDGLPNITSLKISEMDNAPATLAAESFLQMKGLKNLDLSRNHLMYVPRKILDGVKNLQTLNLGLNLISEFFPQSFKGVFDQTTVSETTLDLSFNGKRSSPRKVAFFHPGAFALTGRLTHLILEGMNLQKISCETFEGIVGLKTLNIAHNSFNDLIDLENCSVFPALKGLDLSGNWFQTLSPEFWTSFPLLEDLRMENMQLHEFPFELTGIKTLKKISFCNRFQQAKYPEILAKLRGKRPDLEVSFCDYTP